MKNLTINIVTGTRHANFRKKEEKDFLSEIFEEKLASAYVDGLSDTKKMTLEIKDQNELIGSALIEVNGGLLKIEGFVLKSNYRGQGIGTKALQKIESFAKKNGCHKMWLITNPKLKAVRLYKRMGWNIEAKLRKNIAKFDELLMCKFI